MVGSCYGISAIVVLVSMGVIKPEDIVEEAKTLKEITKTINGKPSKSDEVGSFINLYHLMQCLNIVQNQRYRFLLLEKKEQIKHIEQMALAIKEGGKIVHPFVLGISGKEGGHAVVVYDIEYGDYGDELVQNRRYNARLKLYDCNVIQDNTIDVPLERTDLYINTEMGEWCIPQYRYQYTKLSFAINDEILLNNIHHSESEGIDLIAALITTIFDYKVDYKDKIIDIDDTTDDVENGFVTYFNSDATEDGNSSYMTLTLPDNKGDYSVILNEPENGNIMLNYGKVLLSVTADAMKQIDFK